MTKKPLLQRVARLLARALLWLIALVTGLVLLVAVALDLPPVRELVRKRANAELEQALAGKITLERIGYLGFDGVGGVDATVDDPKGKRVVVLRGLGAETFWPRIVWSALTDESALDIGIDAVSLDHSEIVLRDDGSGGPTLAAAFEPKPTPTPTPAEPSPEVRLRIARIRLNHAWIHGQLAGAPPIDAELGKLEASLATDTKSTRLALDRSRIVTRGLPETVDPSGVLSGRLELPSSAGPRASGRFSGSVASARVDAEGRYDGASLKALLTSPDASPAARHFGLDVRDPTSLRVTVEGRLPDLGVEGKLAGPAILFELRGKARVAEETRIEATADARSVDLARLAGGPRSSLATHAVLAVTIPASGELWGDYQLDVPSGQIEAETTPELETKGRLRLSEAGELRIDGELAVLEPGAPLDVIYQIRTRASGLLAHAELDARLDEPRRLALLGVRAKGTVSGAVDFDSATSTLAASARLRLASVRHEAVAARALVLNAELGGRPNDPTFSAELTAGPVTAAGRSITHLAATVTGKPTRLAVNALVEGKTPERTELSTTVSLGEATELEGLRLALLDEEGRVEIRSEKVRAANGSIEVDGFALHGAGTATGSFDYSPNRQKVELVASDLELGRITRLFAVRAPFERALVSLDVAVERRRELIDGHVRARATEVRIGKLDEASASVDLAFTPRNVSGTASGDFGEGGRFHVELDRFEPPRAPFTLARTLNQPGSIAARGDLGLSGFLPLIQATGLPIERIAGTASFALHAKGGTGEGGPELEARVRTKDLRIVERRPKHDPIRTVKEAREVEPRALEDVDVNMLFRVSPEDELARLELELYDPYGTIVRLNGDAKLPDAWPRTLGKTWRTMPLEAKLEMPRRPFEIFPILVRPKATKGIASASIAFAGSVAAPVLDAEVELDALRVEQVDEPMRVAFSAHYERARGKLSATAETRGQNVADLEGTWSGDAAKLASAATNGPSPIRLDLDGKLRAFPLDSISALADRQIKGALSGNVELEGLGRDAKLAVSLDGSKMTIGQVRMQKLSADIDASAGHLRARIEAAAKKGTAELDVTAPAPWGNRLAPEIPNEIDGRLTAKAFPLETLAPALKRFLNDVGGRLDAELGLKLAPGNNALSGEAKIADGAVQIPAVGERFTDLEARVVIRDDRVLVRDLTARGPTGRVTVRAAARLDGLELVNAEAHINIKEREKIPITLQGASLGDAWGRIAVLYRKQEDATQIRVDVPSLHVEMAEQGDLEVQSLENVESIRIGARLSDGTFTTIPIQPLESGGAASEEESSPLKVLLRLGKDVEIERGRMLRVKLGGDLNLTSDGESRMTGRLELREGKLDVQGKLFDIERGVVTFSGDPSNPTITATARWDSPVGYTVYAEYTGDVQNGKITLRSEPPLNQDEIASLLMFGDPEGSVGTGSGDTNSAATAVGVAGDTAAKGINRALSDLTRLDVAARVDTSTGTARPELVMQLSPRVSAKVTRAVGEPQAGQPPDRTFFTVEFRFTRSWSVSGVVGDHGGSGMDVIWRRRY